MERVMAGPQRKSRVMTEAERRIVAANEARNDAAATGADPAVVDAARARRAKPRQSDEEIAAEAAAFAQAAVAGDRNPAANEDAECSAGAEPDEDAEPDEGAECPRSDS